MIDAHHLTGYMLRYWVKRAEIKNGYCSDTDNDMFELPVAQIIQEREHIDLYWIDEEKCWMAEYYNGYIPAYGVNTYDAILCCYVIKTFGEELMVSNENELGQILDTIISNEDDALPASAVMPPYPITVRQDEDTISGH
jgi:hypothetical protein